MPRTFNDGIDATASLLTSTAEDYEQMATRILNVNRRSAQEEANMRIFQDKARLLRGQIKQILELKE